MDVGRHIVRCAAYVESLGVGSKSAELDLDQYPPMVTQVTLSANPILPTDSTVLTVTASDDFSGLAGGEYYLGPDPGQGNGSAMTLSRSTLTATIGPSIAPGIYTAWLRVVDVAGNWSRPSGPVLVVYDPAAGSVSGTGWIVPGGPTSDVGDRLPGLEGISKASFSLSARYKDESSTAPSGGVSFTYDPGGFFLRSKSLQWLVVTGDVSTLQGTGEGARWRSGGAAGPVRVDRLRRRE